MTGGDPDAADGPAADDAADGPDSREVAGPPEPDEAVSEARAAVGNVVTDGGDATAPPDHRPSNAELASRLEEIATRLAAQDVEYKPTAYRRAAENVRDYPGSVADLAAEGAESVQGIDRVGEAIAGKLVEYVETGSIEELEELREELPVDLDDLTAVEGVGPKTVGTLYRELGVRTLSDLERAAREEQIREVSGFGAKTEQNVLENLEFAKRARGRERLGDVRPVADRILQHLRDAEPVRRAEVAGSIRRWRPTIGDVDVLVAAPEADAEDAVEAFLALGETEIESGPKKASVRLEGVRSDLRVVTPDQFGSALQYFTGSKEHNIQLRNYALDRDVSLNEYGAFDVSDPDVDRSTGPRAGVRIAGETEESMYDALGLPTPPPELREGRGEIKAAAEDALPDLLSEGEVRGDLHVHSTWSDGSESIADMARGAAEFGHDYLAICDHAAGPGVIADIALSTEDLREQRAEIEAAAEEVPIDLFAGVETNVEADGSVSTPDDVLEALDLVVASPHSGLGGEATDRLIGAVEHPHVDVLGHPSGRLLGQRSGLDFDAERLGEAAAANDTALEINANPARLDLWGEAVQAALEAGATVAIDTDAHSIPEFGHVRYGVHTARRGWAEADDVLNAWDVEDVRKFVS